MGMLRGPRSSRRPPRTSPDSRSLAFIPGGAPPPAMPLLPPIVPALPVLPPPVLPPLAPAPNGPPSQVRQNYHRYCENAINRLINLELYASYVYLSMAFHFDNLEGALKHVAPFFLRQSREERGHAQTLMWLQNLRGGRIRLRDIKMPDSNHWESGLKAMKCALHLERTVNQSLADTHQLATNKHDAHLCDFLEHHYHRKQVKSVKELGSHIINLRKMESLQSTLTEYLFDKLTLGDSNKN
ncbi:Ferritin heavy chain [Pteropus alecto]|uniref:Ferritin n=1 Tax=Pteropus alecto TaxID=9402 RepID=L5KYK7_PTEAL|nr:Ferritin heavy chain [Pteropus alecto]